jgi:hypothetical protein
VQGAVTDPVAAYRHLLHITPTRHPEDPLLLLPSKHGRRVVTIYTLRTAFAHLLQMAGLSLTNYTLHSLRRGGATQSFHAGVHQMDVKCHGMWASDTFWGYITSSVVAQSPVATSLAQASIEAASDY